jgi:hypothetical protein
MSDTPNTVVLTEAGLRTVKELRAVIRKAGIEAHILRPPSARNT